MDDAAALGRASDVVVTMLPTGKDVRDALLGFCRDEGFEVARIAPVFRSESRQARVELRVNNPDRRLKPGMFVRAQTVLARVEDATVVPEDALVTREGRNVVFVVSDDGKTVNERPVEVGVREQGRVQVIGEGLTGRVVTLGQQQLEDGTEVTIPPDSAAAP